LFVFPPAGPASWYQHPTRFSSLSTPFRPFIQPHTSPSTGTSHTPCQRLARTRVRSLEVSAAQISNAFARSVALWPCYKWPNVYCF
jgi:hypothetical protein